MRVNDFKWVEDISEFNEDFTKSHDDISDEGYFLKVDIQLLENLHNLHIFLSEIESFKKPVANLPDKTEKCYARKKMKPSMKSWISFEKIS